MVLHGERARVLGGRRRHRVSRYHDPASILAYYRETGDVYERVAALPQPTVAAIHGYCLGGGLELALACDFRVADEASLFGFPEIGLGILPSSGGTFRLVRMLGPARAKELILLRERFSAHRSARLRRRDRGRRGRRRLRRGRSRSPSGSPACPRRRWR